MPAAPFAPRGVNQQGVTSTYRTPQHNREVGGVAGSYHTRRGVNGEPLAVDSLPPRQRDAFVLVHMHGHSGGEAAARLGVSLGNLWIILHRTRKLLQSQLQGKYA